MKTVAATYEDGVFKPKGPVSLVPGAEVDVLMPESGDDLTTILKARFPNSLGGLSDQDADEMMKAVEEERMTSGLPRRRFSAI